MHTFDDGQLRSLGSTSFPIKLKRIWATIIACAMRLNTMAARAIATKAARAETTIFAARPPVW